MIPETLAGPPTSPPAMQVRVAHVQIPRSMLLVIAVVAEVVLALAIKSAPILGLAQAAAIAAIGLYGVLRRDLTVVISTIAYLAGTEILWRQTRVPVFYLAAPYLVIGLSALAVLLVIGRLGRDARIAVLYGALLLPATVATVRTAGQEARELVAFALSGPLALAAFVAFTSQVRITTDLYRRVLWIILVGAVGPLTIAVSDVRADLAAETAITFSKQSNFATSGGFGPVQVSAALSIGMMAAILLVIIERNRLARLLAGSLAFVLGVQTLLTFSRGGSFSILIAMAIFAVTQARDPRIRNRIAAVAIATVLLANFLVFPWLESFTGGMFQQRFSDTTTSRTELAANDTEIFTHNFVFGVGPGMTKYQRLTYEVCQIRSDKCRNEASSHTEFTRTLSEHGIPGVIAVALLLLLAWHAVRRAGPGQQYAVAWMAWAIAQMFYANLRIVAVPIAFGFAFLRFVDGKAPPAATLDPSPDSRIGSTDRVRAAWRADHSLQSMGTSPTRGTRASSRPGSRTPPPIPPWDPSLAPGAALRANGSTYSGSADGDGPAARP